MQPLVNLYRKSRRCRVRLLQLLRICARSYCGSDFDRGKSWRRRFKMGCARRHKCRGNDGGWLETDRKVPFILLRHASYSPGIVGFRCYGSNPQGKRHVISGLKLTQQLVGAHARTMKGQWKKWEKHCERQQALHLSEAVSRVLSCAGAVVLVLGVDIERDADDKVAGRIVDAHEL